MLTVTKENLAEGVGRLKLSGEATIEQVGELRQALLEGLGELERLQVDCAEVTAIDFFTVQLLCSAHRTSVAWGKELTFAGAAPPAVEAGIRRTGFARHRGCSLCPSGVRCLWL
jgi:anti-anti-sigma regulatory factor